MAPVTYSGLASGIDSSALIQALLDQKRAARVEPFETRIAEFEETNDSLTQLKTLLNTLKDAAAKLRTLNGGPIMRQAVSSDETLLTGAASGSALDGTYGLTVSQLARNGSYSLSSANRTYTGGDAAINADINDAAAAADRTVSFSVGSGSYQEQIDVVLTSETSLHDFVNDFNSQSSLATASIVNVGTSTAPNYLIRIASNSTGTERGAVALLSVGDEVANAGNPGGGAFDVQTSSAAQNARFAIDGVTGVIERQSNTVSDVINGVTFELHGTGSAVLEVQSDSGATAAVVQDFVDAYNEVLNFAAESNTITRQEDKGVVKNIFGPLAKTSLDDSIVGALRSALQSASASGGTVNILADLGVTTQRDGTLSFDQEDFEQALQDDPESSAAILAELGETFGAVGGAVDQFTRFNGLIDVALTSNNSSISSLQDSVSTAEDQLAREEESLTARFARLEALIGGMQQQQAALSSILPV